MADLDLSSGDGAELARNVAKYKKALEEEWEAQNPTEEDTPEEIARKARKLVIATFPRLIERSQFLALGASSESVSMQAIKFLYNIIVPPTTITPGTPDPMEELIRQLQTNDPDPKEQ